ncbi:Nn.00g066400.m01.CDS01 [Neocucurbitaria sp. VM-36]
MESLIPVAIRNEFTSDWDIRVEQIRNGKKLLFDDVGEFNARLIRIGNSIESIINPELTASAERRKATIHLKSEVDLEENLLKSSQDDFRILSFFQEFSLSPLMCSESAMLKVMRSWQISSMFIDVLLKFGDKPQVFQESSGFRQSYQDLDGSFELCYQYMYVEPNGKQLPRDPWSFRQTGVYHKFIATNNKSCIVLLHPNDDAIAQDRLDAHTEPLRETTLARHPLNVHLVIISTYLIHWQAHTESLASDLELLRRHIDVVDITGPEAIPDFSPDRLQTLRHIEDKIMCKAYRCLQSTATLVKDLIKINKTLADSNQRWVQECHGVQQELQLFEHRLQGQINAVEILGQRVQATLGLLTDLLNIGNQANSRQISTRILRLTQDNVDDNATVKVITSFLGMNLFQFKSDDGSLQASPQFWIFVVTTVPLTMLTVGAWYLYKTRYNMKRRVKYDEERVHGT